MSAPPAIALVGLRCVGKTSVGRALARELGLGFVDLDEASTWSEGEGCCASHVPTLAQLVERAGWEGFRDVEARELERVLSSGDQLVLATGGGVVERASNRALLRARTRCVWLRGDGATLRERLARSLDDRPPLLGRDALSEWDEIAARREPWYREVAEIELDTAGLDVAAAARRIATALGVR